MKEPRVLMNAAAMKEAFECLAAEIAKGVSDPARVALAGVRSRGIPMARRLRRVLEERHGWKLPVGRLDITLYRDDLSTLNAQPVVGETDLPFDVDGTTVILVDDVMYTGRTARAAIDAIVAFGRPAAIRLAALVDRGWREYPIQPDYCALKVATQRGEIVQAHFQELDGRDEVLLVQRGEGGSEK